MEWKNLSATGTIEFENYQIAYADMYMEDVSPLPKKGMKMVMFIAFQHHKNAIVSVTFNMTSLAATVTRCLGQSVDLLNSIDIRINVPPPINSDKTKICRM